MIGDGVDTKDSQKPSGQREHSLDRTDHAKDAVTKGQPIFTAADRGELNKRHGIRCAEKQSLLCTNENNNASRHVVLLPPNHGEPNSKPTAISARFSFSSGLLDFGSGSFRHVVYTGEVLFSWRPPSRIVNSQRTTTIKTFEAVVCKGGMYFSLNKIDFEPLDLKPTFLSSFLPVWAWADPSFAPRQLRG